jgi:predicted MPP superfamily phosphohydrolase
MVLRLGLFLLVNVLVLGGCARYVHRHATRFAGLGPRARRGLWALFGGGIGLMAVSRMVERWVAPGAVFPFAVAGNLVGVGLLLTTALLIVVDLAAATSAGVRKVTRALHVGASASGPVARPVPDPDPALPAETAPDVALAATVEKPAKAQVSRRGFVTQALTGSALALGGGSAVYGTFFGRHDYQLEDLVVPIPGLSRRLDGFTVVQLSDIHVGLFSGEFEARAAEDLVRRARPDLLVLTGDLIDHDPAYAPALGRLVRRLSALSRHGVVVVPGNHDYYTGIDTVLGAVESAGAVVLRNTGRVIGDAGAGFALLGVDDPSGANHEGLGPDLGAALASLPAAADLPRILLCHNPAYFTEAAGRVALQLSGHTHGGQIKLGVTPASLVHPFVVGQFERSGSRLWVNRGFGTAGPPSRVGAPPEVTRIVLTG